jgi:signal peptidase II
MFLKNKQSIGFMIIIGAIILDQLSKWIVLEKIFKPNLAIIDEPPLGFFDWLTSTVRLDFISLDVLPFFNLTMVWNHGISFGLFQNGNPWPLIIVALIISAIFLVWLCRTTKWIEVICLSMVVGGALGNVIDRLHFGAVADFLDFYVKGWHYPAFNLADSFISVGILILVTYGLFFDKSNKDN